MIRVTIEMVPRGDESAKYVMGTMEIANEGTTTLQDKTRGDYLARIQQVRHGPHAQMRKSWREVQLYGFPRKYLGVYDLIYQVLHEAVGARNQGHIERRNRGLPPSSRAV